MCLFLFKLGDCSPPKKVQRAQLNVHAREMRLKYTPEAIQLALTSGSRFEGQHAEANAINAVMANRGSGAIKKIPKFIQHADDKPTKFSLDHDLACLLYYNLSEHVYRGFTEEVDSKVKTLNWELEKFRVSCFYHQFKQIVIGIVFVF